jgi:hypothetical protein
MQRKNTMMRTTKLLHLKQQRHITKTHATNRPNHQQSTIFQMDPPCGHVTLEDVDDIYPVCNNIQHEEQRYACYACYGMDMKKVEQYYPIVKKLQQQFDESQPGKQHAHVLCLQVGKWRVTICLDVLV